MWDAGDQIRLLSHLPELRVDSALLNLRDLQQHVLGMLGQAGLHSVNLRRNNQQGRQGCRAQDCQPDSEANTAHCADKPGAEPAGPGIACCGDGHLPGISISPRSGNHGYWTLGVPQHLVADTAQHEGAHARQTSTADDDQDLIVILGKPDDFFGRIAN